MTALLAANRRSLWNAAWRRGWRRRLGVVVGAGLVTVCWLGAMQLVQLTVVSSLAAPTSRLLTTVSGALVLLTGFSLVTSVSFAVASGYFAKDVEWLLTLPVSSRGLLAHRLLSQLTLGVAVGTVILGPVLAGAALHSRTLALLPLVVVGLVALLTTPVAIALLVVVVIVRIIPASRVRDGTAALICLAGLAMAGVSITANRGGSGLRWAGAINRLGAGWLHSALLPPGWAARVLTLAWRGEWAGSLLWLLPLVVLALATVSVVLWIAGPLHREGWARAQIAPKRRARRAASWRRLPPVVAVLRKDVRNLRRDPVQLSQLILPLALFAIYLLAPTSVGSQTLFQNFPLWYGPLTTSAFAALFVASGLGLRAVGTEGDRFWCLRSAPLRLRDLLLAKLALPTLVAVGAGLALLWTSELRDHVPPSQMVFSAVLLVLIVTGLAAFATGLGATWPRLDWTDPRRATSIWLSVTFIVLGSVYIGTCIVALTVPLVMTRLGTQGSDLASILACAACAVLAGVGTLWLGYARMQRLEI